MVTQKTRSNQNTETRSTTKPMNMTLQAFRQHFIENRYDSGNTSMGSGRQLLDP